MLGASVLEAEVFAEKGHHVVLEAISDRTCMSSLVDLEAVLQSVLIECVVELDGIDLETVLIADVHGDALVSPQIANVLIDKCQRSIRGPLCENVRLRLTVFDRKIEVERRILGIG